LTLPQSGSELIAQAGGAACEEADLAAIVRVVREIPSRMPNFAYRLCVLLALAVPLVVWLWLRRRRQVVRLPGAEALDRLPGRRARLARWSGAGLRALALILLVLALAGPRWPDRRTRISTEGIAISMVLDTSGSMAEADF